MRKMTGEIRSIATELRDISANVEGATLVTLIVYDGGQWVLIPGNERDRAEKFGGKSVFATVPGVVNGAVKPFDSIDMARKMVEGLTSK